MKQEKKQKKIHNLLFCIIEATPDSHVAWLWYSKTSQGGGEGERKKKKLMVSIQSETRQCVQTCPLVVFLSFIATFFIVVSHV